ncbi:RICIN domain-containing protein [candidate division KSB1 bacterium]|nr:RICIN domain-containing protein [candidate division KSB1 bacterium]
MVKVSVGLVMEVAGGSTARGVDLQQGTNLVATYQHWNVAPVPSRIGGDFSYFMMTAVHSGKAADVYNWSLRNWGRIVVWDKTNYVRRFTMSRAFA